MKIGYFADGPWSHKALEQITQDSRFQVVFIVPRYDTQDPVLKEWAERLEIDYLPIENVNLEENIKKLNSYKAELYVSMSFNQILRESILKSPVLGFINCHAGALPYYRGRNILNWVLINNEKEFGVTVHYIDEGIDTGDIILQKKKMITDQDDYLSLLNNAITLCSEVLFDALVMIEEGTVKRIKQTEIDSVGFYCGRRSVGDEWIDWDWSSRRIFNFVRAITKPGPYARTILNGCEVKIKKAKEIPGAVNYIGTPGEIVDVQNEGITVKTGDSIIFIEDIEVLSKPENRLRIGQRFSIGLGNIVTELQKRVLELEATVLDTTNNTLIKK